MGDGKTANPPAKAAPQPPAERASAPTTQTVNPQWQAFATSPPTASASAKKPPPTALTEKDVLDNDEWVNRTIDGFQSSMLKSQIGNKLATRRTFLRGMRRYLGSLDNVVKHYSQVRPLNIPKWGNTVHLHDRAASRFEAVHTQLQGHVPGTGQGGLGLRDDFKPKPKTGKYDSPRRVLHALGYAIDFRAASNPQIHSLATRTLIRLVTGQSSSTMNLGLEDSARRALIKKAGRAPRSETGEIQLDDADKARWAALMTQVEKEYQRLAKASETFTTNLPPNVLEYKALRESRRNLDRTEQSESKTLDSLRRAKKPDEKAIEEQTKKLGEVTAEKTKTRDRIAAIEGDLPRLFADWLATLKTKMLEIERRANALETGLSFSSPSFLQDHEKKRLDAEGVIKKARENIRNLQNELAKLERSKQPDPKRDPDAAKQLASQKRETQDEIDLQRDIVAIRGDDLARLRQMLEIAKEWGPLEETGKRLLDRHFVFVGNDTAEDPALVQLLEKGFFTPDPAPAEGESFNPSQHGYDLAFFKAMIEHGFDPGISWGEGGADPMHFELIEGAEGVLDANRPDADNVDQPASVTLPTASTEPAKGGRGGGVQSSDTLDGLLDQNTHTDDMRRELAELEAAPAGHERRIRELRDYISDRRDSPLPDYSATLVFDGRHLTLLGHGGRNESYNARSGRPLPNGHFDYSRENQQRDRIGPIPEGIYWIAPMELQNVRNPKDWIGFGQRRIIIHPFHTTHTYRRGGFFIHGGVFPGSAGCIDLQGEMQRFQYTLRGIAHKHAFAPVKIKLIVSYPPGS